MTIETEQSRLLDGIGAYYTGRVREHGATPRGVDWNGAESQSLRFREILRIADGQRQFTLAELGCGYGALVDHLAEDGRTSTYLGVDLSPDMVDAARTRCGDVDWAHFAVADHIADRHDFCVASGVFNVRLETSDADWLAYIHETLDNMDAASTHGFSFNALTSYSDPEKMRDYLYYADPLALFDHCKRRYSRNVSILHDYGLWEFTILVRKAFA